MNKQAQNPTTVDREACALTMPKDSAVRSTTDSGEPVGEGSYEGTKRYAESIGNYLETADVTSDAKAAAPKSPEEARELKQAESEAKNRSQGEDA